MEKLLHFLLQKYVALIFVIVTGAYILSRRNRRLKYYIDKINGPPVVPLLGNALEWIIPHHEVLPLCSRWVTQYGKTYRIWVGSSAPYVFTCDVHVIEKIISSQKYNNKGKYDYGVLGIWLGTGLLTAPASKWFARRKMLTPAFHFKILEDFIPVFNEQASTLVECLGKDGRDDGKQFDLYPYIAKCTLDIICETAMGKKINAQSSASDQEYFNAVNGLTKLIVRKIFRPWLRIPLIYNFTSHATHEKRYLSILKGFTEKVIQARKIERKFCHQKWRMKITRTFVVELNKIIEKQRKAFLDLLLDVADETGQLNDADIREEVDTFMFEGHDTTSASLGWTILLLALHPECQQMVQKELDEIFADNPTRDVFSTDIHKMKLLESCIKESLRLFPSVPYISRAIDTDLVLDNGTIIPKDATALIGIPVFR